MNNQGIPPKYEYLPLGLLDNLAWGDEEAGYEFALLFKNSGFDIFIVDYAREGAEQDYAFCRSKLEKIAAQFGVRIIPSTSVNEIQDYRDQIIREVNNKHGVVVQNCAFSELKKMLATKSQ